MVVDEKPLLAPASVPLPADAWIALRLIEKMELPVIAALAETIWWHCYPPIIGAAQVHYMLGRGYALPVLSAAYRDGTVFSLLQVGPRSVGFSAWRVVGREGFIDKLYLLPAFHGRGLGRWLIDATCRQIAAAGLMSQSCASIDTTMWRFEPISALVSRSQPRIASRSGLVS